MLKSEYTDRRVRSITLLGAKIKRTVRGEKMEEYKPSIPPIAQEWLELDEYERVALVREFHENHVKDLPDDALEIHSLIHVVVENQIAEEVEVIPETIAKLTRQGLDRHEAIHAIGAILSNDVFEIAQGNMKEFSQKLYRRKLDKLTAKRWRKGQW